MLKRSIGPFGLLFTAFGGILGSGWLFGPYYAAQVAGPAAVIAWIIGGLLMITVAMTFAELSSTFPVAGGTVRFLQMSHGPLVSFNMAWIGWLSSVAVAPIETIAAIQYTANYVPTLMHEVNNVHVLSSTGFAVAAVMMIVMCVINAYGVRILSKTNNVVVVVKFLGAALTLLVFISIDFYSENFVAKGFAPYGLKGILSSLPTAGIIFSFLGFAPAVQLAGEAINPQKTVPFALIGALILGILLYVALQTSFIGALNVQDIAHGWNQLDFKGDAGPFAGLAIRLGFAWLAYVLYFSAIVAPFGTALIFTASTARMCYAMGENGYLPKPLMKLNKHRVPLRIILMNYVIGLFLFLPFPTWQKLVSFLVSALVLSYAVGPLALNILRKKLPDQPRPFRLPFPKVMCLAAFYICNLIVFWTGWDIVSKMLIAVVIGYIVLFFYRQTSAGKLLNFNWERSWWIFIYIGGLGFLSYLSSFGGGENVLSFGWDFVVVAIFSWLIYEYSQHSAHR